MTAKWPALFAAALLVATLPVAAQAQWRDQGGRGGGRAYQDRGYGRGGGAGPRGFDGAQGPRGGGFAAPAYGGRSGGFRRGQVLPPEQRGAYVPDPGRYHLRAAPPGYGWVGDGRNAYLTQRSTGMVLDSVPGAYEAPPAYRGRGRRR